MSLFPNRPCPNCVSKDETIDKLYALIVSERAAHGEVVKALLQKVTSTPWAAPVVLGNTQEVEDSLVRIYDDEGLNYVVREDA